MQRDSRGVEAHIQPGPEAFAGHRLRQLADVVLRWCSLGVLLALFLNMLLPMDGEEIVLAELESSTHDSAGEQKVAIEGDKKADSDVRI